MFLRYLGRRTTLLIAVGKSLSVLALPRSKRFCEYYWATGLVETEKCMWKVSILESWIENRLWNHADMNERILTWLETSVRMAFFRPEVAFRIKMFQFDDLAIFFFFICSFVHFSFFILQNTLSGVMKSNQRVMKKRMMGNALRSSLLRITG